MEKWGCCYDDGTTQNWSDYVATHAEQNICHNENRPHTTDASIEGMRSTRKDTHVLAINNAAQCYGYGTHPAQITRQWHHVDFCIVSEQASKWRFHKMRLTPFWTLLEMRYPASLWTFRCRRTLTYLQVGHCEQRQQGEGHQVQQGRLGRAVNTRSHRRRQQTWEWERENHQTCVESTVTVNTITCSATSVVCLQEE